MSGTEKGEPKRETDPEAVAKALELELIMKRASWKKIQARRGTWRILSFLFLFLVILGALLAYFYFVSEMRQPGRPAAESVESGR